MRVIATLLVASTSILAGAPAAVAQQAPAPELKKATVCAGALQAETNRLMAFDRPIGAEKDEDKLMAAKYAWLKLAARLRPAGMPQEMLDRGFGNMMTEFSKAGSATDPKKIAIVDGCVRNAPKP
jgi:hypothetical protein